MPILSSLTKLITNYDSPKSVGSRLRAKRAKLFLSLIDEVHQKNDRVRIIDIGGTRAYWNIIPANYLKEKNVEITLVNLPGSNLPNDETHFIYREGDACNLDEFEENSFDIAHSNSVIEHVGDWSRMKMYATEIKKLAPVYYIQTPNYWFPVEPHCMTPFFHWMPKPMRIWLVMTFNLGHWKRQDTVDGAVSSVESARLLNRKMFKDLFSDATHITERILTLPKSLIAIRK